jgi:hypothetical protein
VAAGVGMFTILHAYCTVRTVAIPVVVIVDIASRRTEWVWLSVDGFGLDDGRDLDRFCTWKPEHLLMR